MDIVELVDRGSGSTARIAAHLGFNCFAFVAGLDGRTVDVIDADPAFVEGKLRPSGHGIPILFPYPNRIRAGRFAWAGRSYHVPASRAWHDPRENSLHGFCLDRPWRVVERKAQVALGRFRLSVDAPDRIDLWPADFEIDVRYELRGPTLRTDFAIRNPDTVPLPWGLGTHAYFKVPLASDSRAEDCVIEVPAAEVWEAVDNLPTGRRLPVPREKDLRDGAYFDLLKLDDVLTGFDVDPTFAEPDEDAGGTVPAIETLILDEGAGLQMLQRTDPAFRELVAFTPPNRSAVCLEPYTCTPDAINLAARGIDAGWRVLEPGGEFRTWTELRIGPVVG